MKKTLLLLVALLGVTITAIKAVNQEFVTDENNYFTIEFGDDSICTITGKGCLGWPGTFYYIVYNRADIKKMIINEGITSIEGFIGVECPNLTEIVFPESLESIGAEPFRRTPWYNNQPDGCLYINKCLWGYKGTMPENTHIDVKEGTLIIGGGTFSGCSSLTSITIPNSVTSIGYSAFSGCSSLISISIPNSVTSIGNYAFQYCESLTSISIPNSVTSIGNDAFSFCSSLTSITIPNSVTSIGSSAFSYCSSLTSITIPNSVTSIGYSAFSGCSSLTSISIPNSVTSIGSSAFSYCSSLTSITIPNSVTSIGYSAFSGCSSLTSITIPNSVTSIGEWAFSDCDALTSITIPNSVTSIGRYAFHGTPWLNNQPDGCLYIGKCLYQYRGEMPENTHIDVNEGTTMICGDAFNGCSSLTSISIPNSVTSIGNEAFSGCSSLTSISIPNSVTSIGSSAFSYCSSLTSITIPNSVTSIGYSAFSFCSSLDTLICNCNDSLIFDTDIDYNPFKIPTLRYLTAPAVAFNTFREENQTLFSNKLTEVHISDGELNENGFNFINRSKKTLHTIDLDSATNTTINDLAFYDCYKLENLTLPKNVETIGYKAFADCKHLTELTIPASVTEIGESAFENCRSINTLTFEEGSALESISSWAFYNNHALESVELPEGVKEIGNAAFYGCTYVEEIVIPSSVERIGDNGFALCNQVKRMEVRATTPPTIEAKTFHQVSRSIEFIVPADARNAYAEDEYWREFIQEAPTNVENTIEGVEIYTQNGTLHIEGATENYHILDAAGRLIYSGNATTLTLPRGIYLITMGGEVEKIVL